MLVCHRVCATAPQKQILIRFVLVYQPSTQTSDDTLTETKKLSHSAAVVHLHEGMELVCRC